MFGSAPSERVSGGREPRFCLEFCRGVEAWLRQREGSKVAMIPAQFGGLGMGGLKTIGNEMNS